MNSEEKILSLLEKMYIDFDKRFEGMDKRFEGMDKRLESIEAEFSGINGRLTNVEGIVVRIEKDHGQKLGALFDGYKLNSEKLERIEAEVIKHEEIILRRIR